MPGIVWGLCGPEWIRFLSLLKSPFTLSLPVLNSCDSIHIFLVIFSCSQIFLSSFYFYPCYFLKSLLLLFLFPSLLPFVSYMPLTVLLPHIPSVGMREDFNCISYPVAMDSFLTWELVWSRNLILCNRVGTCDSSIWQMFCFIDHSWQPVSILVFLQFTWTLGFW